MVERDLAKVEVAGSTPVSRSIFAAHILSAQIWPLRREGLCSLSATNGAVPKR
ncbi:MAG: hypothetical protein JWO13_1326 [Acidobacteriales bacterium]|nr:hypothetical protein [Terriglobales bacterium]